MKRVAVFALLAVMAALGCAPPPTAFEQCYHGIPLEVVVNLNKDDSPEVTAAKAACSSRWLENAYAEAQAQNRPDLPGIQTKISAFKAAVADQDAARMIETFALARCSIEGNSK